MYAINGGATYHEAWIIEANMPVCQEFAQTSCMHISWRFTIKSVRGSHYNMQGNAVLHSERPRVHGKIPKRTAGMRTCGRPNTNIILLWQELGDWS